MRQIAALLLFAITGSAFAGPTYVSQTTHVEVVIPTHMSVDGQVYSFDPRGMREYLTNLEDEGQDELVKKLRPKVDELDSKTSSARAALVIGGGIGLGFMIYAAVLPKEKVEHVTPIPGDFASEVDADIENGSRDIDADGRRLKKQMTLGTIGVLAMLGGFGISKMLAPTREDLMGFVNLHNRKAKQYKLPKIEMNLGDTTRSDKTFSLAWSF